MYKKTTILWFCKSGNLKNRPELKIAKGREKQEKPRRSQVARLMGGWAFPSGHVGRGRSLGGLCLHRDGRVGALILALGFGVAGLDRVA